MGKFLLRCGSFLVFSRRRRNVRAGFIGIFTNLMVAAAILFSLEIVLILMGIGDVFIPLTCAARSFLTGLFF